MPWWVDRIRRYRWANVEGVRDAVEEVEQRCIVDRFGDLCIRPAGVPQALNLLIGDVVGVTSQGAHELQQQPLGSAEPRRLKIAFAQRLGGLVVLLAVQLPQRFSAET